MCFSNRLTQKFTKLHVSWKFGIAVSSRSRTSIAAFLNFYVSHGSATRVLRNGEKRYIYFIDNSLLFPSVK